MNIMSEKKKRKKKAFQGVHFLLNCLSEYRYSINLDAALSVVDSFQSFSPWV